MGISIRQAAVELGVSHVALLKAHKTGSAKFEPDGSVDLEKVKQSEWWHNRAGKISAKPKINRVAKPEEKPVAPMDEKARLREKAKLLFNIEDPEILLSDKINLEKLLILERREALRLDNEERRGNLVRFDAVDERWQRISSQLKGKLLLLPGKLAAKLVTEDDARKIQKILESEIRQTLTVLSEMKIDAA